MGNTVDSFDQEEEEVEESTLFEKDEDLHRILHHFSVGKDDLAEILSYSEIENLKNTNPYKLYIFLRKLTSVTKNILDGDAEKSEMVGTYHGKIVTAALKILTAFMTSLCNSSTDAVLYTLFWDITPQFLSCNQTRAKDETAKEAVFDTHEKSILVDSNQESTDDIGELCKPLGHEILELLFRLLFWDGFCCHKNDQLFESNASEKTDCMLESDLAVAWSGGRGITKTVFLPPTTEMLESRVVVFHCLIACLSEPLFCEAMEYMRRNSMWWTTCTSGCLPYSSLLFISLLSCILSYDPSKYSKLSLSLLNLNNGKAYQKFLMAGLHFAILAVGVKCNTATTDIEYQDDALPKSYDFNIYRQILFELSNSKDFDFMLLGFLHIFGQLQNSVKSLRFISYIPIPFYREVTLLFWYCISICPAFLRHIGNSGRSNKLMFSILFLLLQSSSTKYEAFCSLSADDRFCHLCAFIVLSLSSDRNIAINLNEECTEKFPFGIGNFKGCYTDLMVLVIHQVIINRLGRHGSTLTDLLLTAFANISAYIKHFSMNASAKVSNLVNLFRDPRWLLRGPYHYLCLFFLFESINNLIQYNYEGSIHLLYSILRRHKMYEELDSTSFESLINLRNVKERAAPFEKRPIRDGKKNINETFNSSAIKEDTKKFRLSDDSCSTSSTGAWQSSKEWYDAWKKNLPTQTVTALISHLLPMVEKECNDKELTDYKQVTQYLKKLTLVGVLPPPPAVLTRSYQQNTVTDAWLSSFGWSLVIIHSQQSLIYNWKKVKLVTVRLAEEL